MFCFFGHALILHAFCNFFITLVLYDISDFLKYLESPFKTQLSVGGGNVAEIFALFEQSIKRRRTVDSNLKSVQYSKRLST